MSLKVFRIKEGSPQHQFRQSRAQIRGFTGGFGNGKTAAICVEAIDVASSYKGARCLVGRATRPKLEDSTKKELLKWVPSDWVESWPSDRKNNLVLKNGSSIEFRHIRQEGKGKGEEQSNLLSATYDYIAVDQMDDPEFVHKDFEDLFGRLRGNAQYTGEDPTMPKFGPQRLDFTANPTRNWLFRKVVNPYFIYKNTGVITEGLLYDPETKEVLLEVFNADSMSNVENTGERFIQRMRAVYRGAHKKRFIDGAWDAYEGLVYPDWHETVHLIREEEMAQFIKNELHKDALGVLEAYDYGQAAPSCYGLAFHNSVGDVFLVDGFYRENFRIKDQASTIKEIRNKWGIIPKNMPFADPDIFRKKQATTRDVGKAVSQMFADEGILFQRGTNNITGGIAKVSSYLAIDKHHMHPIKRVYGAPRFFVSSTLEWFENEIVDYYWNKNTHGLNVDKPRDVNDHAMDMVKYLFTRLNKVIGSVTIRDRGLDARVHSWHEMPDQRNNGLLPRHM